MATIVLGALGTAVGGPLGGMVGATLGRGIDALAIGSPRHEAPRLKELAVTTSSYGQPLAATYGAARVAGTLIWATDLQERSETEGGAKGSPRTTSYRYSASFAVALSSRPIDRLGRIWADGNLLRGAAGDLKTGGTLRVHDGHEDQQSDPLMAAVLGERCPAHRGSAYVVFEDLALAEFGNRIPALSFEIFAGDGSSMVADLSAEQGLAAAETDFPALAGYIHEGGALAGVFEQIDRLRPLAASSRNGAVALGPRPATGAPAGLLPEAVQWTDGDFGRADGRALARQLTANRFLRALRHYDPARDYLPGLQRRGGDAGGAREETLECPAVLAAADARSLLEAAALRETAGVERLHWRMAELDPALVPGCVVRAPGYSGLWQIEAWEWRERGIELDLTPHLAQHRGDAVADPGTGWTPPDRLPVGSNLRVFELPWDGSGSSEAIARYAAVGAPSGRWSGAALYAVSGAALVPIGAAGSRRAIGGTLVAPLAASNALRFEPSSTLTVRLDDAEAELDTADLAALANGANRLLVGEEVVQFAIAEPLGDNRWSLRGLLRGRGGSEQEALTGHAVGTAITLLDDRLFTIPWIATTATAMTFAAIGLADEEPVLAPVERPGRSRELPFPVHPRAALAADGSVELCWTRRARGGWSWLEEVAQPLMEQREEYEVGLGDPTAPLASWTVDAPRMTLDAATFGALSATFPGRALWVRQIGNFSKSAALMLATVPTQANRRDP